MPPAHDELLREVDPLGRVVRLTKDQWFSHILPRHPEVESLERYVGWAVQRPDMVCRDALQEHRECYYLEYPGQAGTPKLLKLVVDFQPHDTGAGFMVTCFLTRRIKPGEEVLWSPST